MAQRPSSPKSKRKSKTQAKSPPKSKIKAKAKLKGTPKVSAKKTAKKKTAKKAAAKTPRKSVAKTTKSAKANARRTARAVQGRRPQRTAGGRRTGLATSPPKANKTNKVSKAGKVGVETRPKDMDPQGINSRREPGFVFEEEPRQSADESFSPGNYEPGNVGEPKVTTRRRGVTGNGESETETTPATGPRSTTDGALAEDSPAERSPTKPE